MSDTLSATTETLVPIFCPKDGVRIPILAAQIGAVVGPKHDFFRIGSRLVRVVLTTPERPRLETLDVPTLYGIIQRRCSFVAQDKDGTTKMVSMADHVLEKVTKDENFLSKVAPLRLVSRAPILARVGDDAKLLGKGYNPELGGVFVTEKADLPEVGLPEAVAALTNLTRDFAYKDESDRSRHLAAMLLRALAHGGFVPDGEYTPITVFEADKHGSGKTYAADSMLLPYRLKAGRFAAEDKRSGVGGPNEELAKLLIDGNSVILLDNVSGPFRSSLLASLVTTLGIQSVRAAYHPMTEVDVSRVLYLITSNNFQPSPELADRFLVVRLQSKEPGYRFHEWRDADDRPCNLQQHVASRDLYYLACVYAIVRRWFEGWKADGFPVARESEGRASFKAWEAMAEAINRGVLGREVPVMAGHRAIVGRFVDPDRNFLRAVCEAARTDPAMIGVPRSATYWREFCLAREIPVPGFNGAGGGKTMEVLIGGIAARAFNGSDRIELEGFTIDRTTEKGDDEQGWNEHTGYTILPLGWEVLG